MKGIKATEAIRMIEATEGREMKKGRRATEAIEAMEVRQGRRAATATRGVIPEEMARARAARKAIEGKALDGCEGDTDDKGGENSTSSHG
jgi:hypothetical protein